MFSAIDIALIKAEWVSDSAGPRKNLARCAVCGPCTDWKHQPGCEMDLALAERGFATNAERSEALARICLVSAGTGVTSEQPGMQRPVRSMPFFHVHTW